MSDHDFGGHDDDFAVFGDPHDTGGHDPGGHELPELPDHGLDEHDPDSGLGGHDPGEHWHTPPVAEHHDTSYEDLAADEHPADAADDTAAALTPEVFPPAVDVGDLPEPVDGFPWIDTGSLGVVPATALTDAGADPVDPAGLAEYAAAELPPAADPWAALAADEDPATSALARWWREN